MPEQTLLVTGGAGFIGSNFIPYFLNRYPQYRIVNVDKLTAAASLSRLKSVEGHPPVPVYTRGHCEPRTHGVRVHAL